MKDATFLRTKRLEYLDISSNLVEELGPETFKYLNSLKHLNMSWNKIEVIDENLFEDLVGLEELYMQKNVIKSLVREVFERNTELKTINLTDNRISALPFTTFSNLNNLNSLDIQNNSCVNSQWSDVQLQKASIENTLQSCSLKYLMNENEINDENIEKFEQFVAEETSKLDAQMIDLDNKIAYLERKLGEVRKMAKNQSEFTGYFDMFKRLQSGF